MSTTSLRVQQIATSLDDKAYSEAFVSAEIATTLPFQLREMRKARGWKQADVADLTDQNQKTISDFENPNKARYTLRSLKKLAAAFDVALIVRFAPFSELVDWTANLSAHSHSIPERAKDVRLKRQRDMGTIPEGSTSSSRFGTDATSKTLLIFSPRKKSSRLDTKNDSVETLEIVRASVG